MKDNDPEQQRAEPAPPEAPAANAAQAANEVADLKDKLLRALAENENVRRRAAREREDTAKYAVASFARDMLGIADNLRRALENAPADGSAQSFVEGVALIERELLAALERHGIRKIDPLGEKYDPELHEAMFELPSDQPPGTVVQAIEPGYMIQDRLLRPARVAVAKAAGEASASEPGRRFDGTA